MVKFHFFELIKSGHIEDAYVIYYNNIQPAFSNAVLNFLTIRIFIKKRERVPYSITYSIE